MVKIFKILCKHFSFYVFPILCFFSKSVPFKLVNTDVAPSVEVFGKIYSPSEIIAHIFKRMKMVAEEDLEEERSATTILKKKVLKNAVIAIPAYFTSTQITILEEAFRRAELQLVSIVPEPVAAAMAYGLDNVPAVKKYLFIYFFLIFLFLVLLFSIWEVAQ